MCEPVTIGAIVAAGVGMAVQASAASARGAAVREGAIRNAVVAERQAADAVARATLPGARMRMRGGQFVGVQEAHFGASGVLAGGGSAGDLTKETRIISDVDEEVIRNNAAREAFGFRTGAQRHQQEGAYAASEAENALRLSVIGGVGKMAMIGAKSWMDIPDTEDWGAAGPPPPAPEA